ncbi:MAG: hypothetical protein DRP64_11225 [Verrucomicrobia bacterium]|nr:MAG: hypothetical protein DRP64_11225 [Verrucomicrobiota bacterium]
MMRECEANGWQVIVGIEPDKPEDISHVKKLRNRSPKNISTTERIRPLSGNNFCPCGSGKKYKKCCQTKNSE